MQSIPRKCIRIRLTGALETALRTYGKMETLTWSILRMRVVFWKSYSSEKWIWPTFSDGSELSMYMSTKEIERFCKKAICWGKNKTQRQLSHRCYDLNYDLARHSFGQRFAEVWSTLWWMTSKCSNTEDEHTCTTVRSQTFQKTVVRVAKVWQ